MPRWKAKFNWSILHELQWIGATDELDAAIMQRSSSHLQSDVSCSMPKLCPISCATVVATTLTIWLWSIDTPPEYSNVHIGPFKAFPKNKICFFLFVHNYTFVNLPTTPPSKWAFVSNCALSFGWSLSNIFRRYCKKLVKVLSPSLYSSISLFSFHTTMPTSTTNMFKGTYS